MIELGRRQDAALERARRRGAGGARRRRAGRLLRARAGGGAADARDAGAALAHADAEARCWSSGSSRARASTSSSTPSPAATRTSASAACSPGGSRSDAPNTFSISINDYGLELLSAHAGRSGAAARPEPLRRGRPAARRAGEPELERARAPALSRDRARRRPDLHRLSRASRRATRQLQASSTLFYEVFRKYDAGNMLLDAGRRARC